MTKKILILSILLAGMLMIVISCVKDSQEGTGEWKEEKQTGYSDTESTAEFIARAQQFFEATYSPEVKTRTAQHMPKSALLSSMEVFPDWERSRMSSNEETAYIEFPLISEKRHGVGIGSDTTRIHAVEQRLVVKKDRETGQLEMFTSLLVPSDRKSEAALSKTAMLRLGNFSGTIYLFTPDGQFYNGTEYEKGVKTAKVELQESDEMPETRSGGIPDWLYECIIELYTIYDNDCYYRGSEILFCTGWYISDQWIVIRCPEPENNPGGGGGGVPYPPKPPTDPKPKPTIDKKRATTPESDCSGNATEIRNETGELLNALEDIVPGKPSPNSSNHVDFQAFLDACNNSPNNEHSISWDRYTSLDTPGVFSDYISPVEYGNETSVDLNFERYRTIGNVHNHPAGTLPTPSAQDLVSAAHYASTSEGGIYKFSAVRAPDGTFYVIYIEDHEAAGEFYEKIQEQIDPTNNWFEEGSDMWIYVNQNKDFNGIANPDERRLFQMADLLQNYDNCDSGMRLVKVNPNGSAEAYGVKQEQGKKFKTPVKCQ